MPKIRITEKDLTGTLQPEQISNTVFVPVEAVYGKVADSKAVLTEFSSVNALTTYAKANGILPKEEIGTSVEPLGYKLCKHLIKIGLKVLVKPIEVSSDVLKQESVGDGVSAPSIEYPVHASRQVWDETWVELKDKGLYDIRFITLGAFSNSDDGALDGAAGCAQARGDCAALFNLDINEANFVKDTSGTATTDTAQSVVEQMRKPFEKITVEFDEFAAAFVPNFTSINSDLAKSHTVNYYSAESWIYAPDQYQYLLADQFFATVELIDSGEIIEVPAYPAFYVGTDENNIWKENGSTVKITIDQIVDGENQSVDKNCLLIAINANESAVWVSDEVRESKKPIPVITSRLVANPIKTLAPGAVPISKKSEEIAQEIPAAFGYLFAYANSIKNNPEWYAIAGFQRGVIPELETVMYELSAAEMDALQCRAEELDGSAPIEDNTGIAINPIAYVRPAGYIIYGNRTLKDNTYPIKTTATSFLNVRNLASAIKKQLYNAARTYTFEPNNELLWIKFQSYVTPLLDQMQAGNGILGYKFTKLVTPAKARLKCRLTIIPVEAVEDFDIEVALTDSLTVTE